MPWKYPTSCPTTPSKIAAYLAHESLTPDEAEVVGPREVAAWDVESGGWSPHEFRSWTDENAAGWPRVTFANFRNRFTDKALPWTIVRGAGQLAVYTNGTDGVPVSDMKAAMDYVRAQLVRPLATAA